MAGTERVVCERERVVSQFISVTVHISLPDCFMILFLTMKYYLLYNIIYSYIILLYSYVLMFP
jgi:hypothetical protein